MEKRKFKRSRLLLSVLALFEAVLLTVGVTFAWMEGGKRSEIKSNGIIITAGSNLIMYQDGSIVTDIILDPCELEETSSKDGRNFFFPMADNSSSITRDMTFREGTPADRNKKYISTDFELMAGDTNANVYLGAGTIIECDNPKVLSALRMSFSCNDGSDPIVFKPNQLPGIIQAVTFSPITSIDDAGAATTETQETKSYGDYYYKGEDSSTNLFSIEAQQKKLITLSIWLEGTEFGPTDNVADWGLKIYIDFTTSVDDLVRYNLKDNTHGYTDAQFKGWLTDQDQLAGQKYDTMMYLYDTAADRYYAMSKSNAYNDDHIWSVYVPDTIENFVFRRYCVDIDTFWNEWNTGFTGKIPNDPYGGYTYVAIAGNRKNTAGSVPALQYCGGYWMDSKDTIRVFFELDDSTWTNLKCYAWENEANGNNDSYSNSTGAWPGKAMSYAAQSDNNHAVYYIDIENASKLAGIQFNSDGKNVEITDRQYFFNGYTLYKGTSSTTQYIYMADNEFNPIYTQGH